MNKRWPWIISILVMAAAIIVIGFAWRPWIGNADALTKEAAEQAVLQLYPGQVIGTKLSKGVYAMQLKTDKGLYEMKVDAGSGEILSLQRLDTFDTNQQAEQVTTIPPTPSKEIPTTEPSKTPAATHEKPNKDLPKAQTPKVQTPTELSPSQQPAKNSPKAPVPQTQMPQNESPKEDSAKQPAPTLLTAADASLLAAKHVKGEVKDTNLRQTVSGAYYLVEIRGAKDKRAVVQVNAITGAIMSVTWDDHHRGEDRKGKHGGSDDSGKQDDHGGDD